MMMTIKSLSSIIYDLSGNVLPNSETKMQLLYSLLWILLLTLPTAVICPKSWEYAQLLLF